jgi:hypothetical protein
MEAAMNGHRFTLLVTIFLLVWVLFWACFYAAVTRGLI